MRGNYHLLAANKYQNDEIITDLIAGGTCTIVSQVKRVKLNKSRFIHQEESRDYRQVIKKAFTSKQRRQFYDPDVNLLPYERLWLYKTTALFCTHSLEDLGYRYIDPPQPGERHLNKRYASLKVCREEEKLQVILSRTVINELGELSILVLKFRSQQLDHPEQQEKEAERYTTHFKAAYLETKNIIDYTYLANDPNELSAYRARSATYTLLVNKLQEYRNHRFTKEWNEAVSSINPITTQRLLAANSLLKIIHCCKKEENELVEMETALFKTLEQLQVDCIHELDHLTQLELPINFFERTSNNLPPPKTTWSSWWDSLGLRWKMMIGVATLGFGFGVGVLIYQICKWKKYQAAVTRCANEKGYEFKPISFELHDDSTSNMLSTLRTSEAITTDNRNVAGNTEAYEAKYGAVREATALLLPSQRSESSDKATGILIEPAADDGVRHSPTVHPS